MQEVCKVKVAWDQPLVGEPLSRWEGMIEAWKDSVQFRIPRYYISGLPVNSSNKVQLFGFCDALIAVYADVVESSDD